DKEQPGSVDVVLLRAEMSVARKKHDEAAAILAKAIAGAPKQAEFWTAAAALKDRQGKPDDALKLLDEAQRQVGDAVERRRARARVWAGRRGAESADALRALEKGADALPADQQTALLNGLAESNYRAGHVAEAGRLWRQLAGRPQHARNLKLRL